MSINVWCAFNSTFPIKDMTARERMKERKKIHHKCPITKANHYPFEERERWGILMIDD